MNLTALSERTALVYSARPPDRTKQTDTSGSDERAGRGRLETSPDLVSAHLAYPASVLYSDVVASYVFHEVRVPLNTALLAAQNVQACLGPAAHEHKVEFTALSGSLNQMSAVLNDILDFNRMESGKFAFVAQVRTLS
jgi:signal transduction histidine kinase